jgi:hypothetical protein
VNSVEAPMNVMKPRVPGTEWVSEGEPMGAPDGIVTERGDGEIAIVKVGAAVAGIRQAAARRAL